MSTLDDRPTTSTSEPTSACSFSRSTLYAPRGSNTSSSAIGSPPESALPTPAHRSKSNGALPLTSREFGSNLAGNRVARRGDGTVPRSVRRPDDGNRTAGRLLLGTRYRGRGGRADGRRRH